MIRKVRPGPQFAHVSAFDQTDTGLHCLLGQSDVLNLQAAYRERTGTDQHSSFRRPHRHGQVSWQRFLIRTQISAAVQIQARGMITGHHQGH